MLRIALCDDNPAAVKRYAQLIFDIAERHRIELELSCFDSAEALLFHFADAPQRVDVIFLDIMMDKTDGMEAAYKLRDDGCRAQIIFLTSTEDYVYRAFDVGATQYLLKEQTDSGRFEEVFLRALSRAARRDEELFTFSFGGQACAVPIYQILYFEIWQRIITVHYGQGETARFYSSMEQLESKLEGYHFARAHRSYLVHLSHIAAFGHQHVRLKNGQSIPIGITYAQSLKKAFSDYISRFHIYHGKENGRGEAL